MPKISKNRALAYIFLIVSTSLWGFASPIIKYSLNFTSPSIFLFYRYLIATVIFLPFYLFFVKKNKPRLNLKLLIFLALLSTPLTLLPLFYGLTMTTSVESSILVSTSPILTIIGGMLFLKETIKPKEWLGFGLAIIGTLLLTIEPLIKGSDSIGNVSIAGNLLILLSNLVWTVFLLISKKYKVEPIILTFLSFLVSIPFFLTLSLSFNSNLSLNMMALPGVLYMVIAGSIIAFLAYQEGQKRIEASEAAMFTYIQPLFTLPLAYLWLHEPITPISIISLVIILVGVFYAK